MLGLVDHRDARQLLLRALIFRWACEVAWDQGGARTPHHVWERVAHLVR